LFSSCGSPFVLVPVLIVIWLIFPAADDFLGVLVFGAIVLIPAIVIGAVWGWLKYSLTSWGWSTAFLCTLTSIAVTGAMMTPSPSENGRLMKSGLWQIYDISKDVAQHAVGAKRSK
jgi:hypothetical protein